MPQMFTRSKCGFANDSEGAGTASTSPASTIRVASGRGSAPRFAGFPKGLVEVREQEAASRGEFLIGGIVAGQAVLLGERGASPTDPVTGIQDRPALQQQSGAHPSCPFSQERYVHSGDGRPGR